MSDFSNFNDTDNADAFGSGASGIINPAEVGEGSPLQGPENHDPGNLNELAASQGGMSFGDYANDAFKGVANGAVGTIQGLGQFADSISESFGYDLADDSWWNPLFETRSWVGSLTKNAVQFAALAIPVSGVMGALGSATKITKAVEAVLGARGATVAGLIAKDAAVASLSHVDAKGSLAQLVKDNGWLQNELVDWMAYNESSDDLEARLKSTFENTLIGLPMMALGAGIKSLWGSRNARMLAEADAKTITKANQLTQDLIDNPQHGPAELAGVKVQKTVIDSTRNWTVQRVTQKTAETTTESVKYVNPDNPKEMVSIGAYWAKRTDLPTDEALDGAVRDMMTWINENPGQIREAMFESVQNFVNHTKIDISDDAHNLIDIVAQKVLKPFEQLDTKAAHAAAVEAAKACELSGDEMAFFLKAGEQLAGNMQVRAVITDLTARTLNASYSQKAAVLIKQAMLEQAPTEDLQNAIMQYMGIAARTEAISKKISSVAAQVLASRKVVVGSTDTASPIGELGEVLAQLTTKTKTNETTTTALADYTQRDIYEVVRKTFLTKNADERERQFSSLLRLMGSDDQTRLLTEHAENLRKFGEGAWKTLETTMMASLLSSPKTLGTIGISGVLMTGLKAAEKVAGGVLTGNGAVAREGYDTIAGLFGQLLPFTRIAQAFSDAEVPSLWTNARKGWASGAPVADAMFHPDGGHQFGAAALGLSPENPLRYAADYYGKLTGFFGRNITGLDELIKTSNINGLAYAKAMREMRAQGLTKTQMVQQLPERIATYFKDSAKLGQKTLNDGGIARYAQEVTMSNPLDPGTLGKTVQDAVNRHPALKVIMPFVKVSVNTTNTFRNMTPGLNLLRTKYRDALLFGTPDQKAVAHGQMALGGLLWTLALLGAKQGMITGSGPADRQLRSQMENEGWQARSFRYTDIDGKHKYVSYDRLDIFGTILGMAADFMDRSGALDDNDREAVAVSMMTALASNLTNKTFLTGLSKTLNQMTSETMDGSKFAANIANQFAPGVLVQAQNPDAIHEARTFAEKIYNKIPGLNNDLPVKRNIFGEKVLPRQGWTGVSHSDWWSNLVSPLAYREDRPDNIGEAFEKLKYRFSDISEVHQGIALTLVKNKDGTTAFDRVKEIMGEVKDPQGRTVRQAIADLVDSEAFKAAPEPAYSNDAQNPRVRMINAVLHGFQSMALGRMHQEFPEVRQLAARVKMTKATNDRLPRWMAELTQKR